MERASSHRLHQVGRAPAEPCDIEVRANF